MNQQYQPAGSASSALFGPRDVDPGRWRPLFYPVEIDVPVALGGQGRSSIVLNAQPYILTRIQGKIVGETADPSTTGLYQDGQWDIELQDEQSNYQSGPIAGDLLMGGPSTQGYSLALPIPIPFAGNKTLSFRITNRVLRVLTSEAEVFRIQIVLHGIADWGTLQSSQT